MAHRERIGNRMNIRNRKKRAFSGKKRLFVWTLCFGVSICSAGALEQVSAGTGGTRFTGQVSAGEAAFWELPKVQVSLTEDGTLPDSDVLAGGYIDKQFGKEEHLARLFNSHAGSRLSGNGKKIYDFLKAEVTKVADGEQASAQFTLPVREILDKLTYTENEMGLSFRDPDTGRQVSREKQVEILDQFRNRQIISDAELYNMFNSLLADCPYELYWYDKAAQGSFRMAMSGAQIRNGGTEGVLSLEQAVLTFSFSVGNVYGSGYQVDAAKTAAAHTAAENAKRIVREAAGLSDYRKLMYYKQRICELASYNREAAATRSPQDQNPWQLVYVFDGDDTTGVVCEGYAKAFQYLCDETEFSDPQVYSYIVTGTMTGGTTTGLHMWNIVHMGEFGNYLVDVTNCDQGTIGADDALFLAGAAYGDEESGYSVTVTAPSQAEKTVFYQYRPYMLEIYSKDMLALEKGGRLKESDVHVHSWQESERTSATCTSPGEVLYTCPVCGRTKSEEIPVSGHVYEAVCQWQENQAATVTFACKYDSAHKLPYLAADTGQESGLLTADMKDAGGNWKYSLQIDRMDLTIGNSLAVYSLDDAGAYRMVDDQTYTINEDGSIRLSLPENRTYRFLNAAQAEEAGRKIFQTITLQKKSAAVKKGKRIQMRFGSGLDMENVKSISYTSSKKTVAKVSANGMITAKKAGMATVRAKVVLKNGLVRTVSMKVQVV